MVLVISSPLSTVSAAVWGVEVSSQMYTPEGDSWMREPGMQRRIYRQRMDNVLDERSGREWGSPQSPVALGPNGRLMDRAQMDSLWRHIAQIMSDRTRMQADQAEGQDGLPQISEWSEEVAPGEGMTPSQQPYGMPGVPGSDWPTGRGEQPASLPEGPIMYELPTQRKDPGANNTKALTAGQVAQYAYNAGFRGNGLVTIVAIAMGESSNVPTAYNPVGRDNSYGLLQINMKDDDPQSPMMGQQRRQRYGIQNEDLFDPEVNLRVAFDIAREGTRFTAWSVYNSGKFLEFWDVASQAAQAVSRGQNPDYPMGGS